MELWILMLVIGGAGAAYAATFALPRFMMWLLNPPATPRRGTR